MKKEEEKALLRLLDALETWNKAYPLYVFPEPDMDKADKALIKNEMALNSIAASCMRHVVSSLCEVYRGSLSTSELDLIKRNKKGGSNN